MPILKTIDLKKSYRIGSHWEPVLMGIDMEIKEGEFACIVGPSGCGKSTLLHLLGGLHRATSGRIFLDGDEITALSDAALAKIRRNKMGFVFQRFNLLPTLSARGNIEIASPHTTEWSKCGSRWGWARRCATSRTNSPSENSSASP